MEEPRQSFQGPPPVTGDLAEENRWLQNRLEWALRQLEEVLLRSREGEAVILRELEAEVARYRALLFDLLQALAATIDAKDRYTHGHSRRVAFYAESMAVALHLDRREREWVRIGGLLHDIGKIGIPDGVLNKPVPLAEEEWALMREHPRKGYEIVRNVHGMGDVALYVLHHHERWDGRGYPEGLQGDGIPLGARLIACADCFDSLTSDRIYRPRFPAREALRVMEDLSGVQYDPLVLRALQEVVEARENGGDSGGVRDESVP